MNTQLPIDSLSDKESLILHDAWRRLNEEVMRVRSTGKPGAVLLRLNLNPGETPGPSLVRGKKFTVECE